MLVIGISFLTLRTQAVMRMHTAEGVRVTRREAKVNLST